MVERDQFFAAAYMIVTYEDLWNSSFVGDLHHFNLQGWIGGDAQLFNVSYTTRAQQLFCPAAERAELAGVHFDDGRHVGHFLPRDKG